MSIPKKAWQQHCANCQCSLLYVKVFCECSGYLPQGSKHSQNNVLSGCGTMYCLDCRKQYAVRTGKHFRCFQCVRLTAYRGQVRAMAGDSATLRVAAFKWLDELYGRWQDRLRVCTPLLSHITKLVIGLLLGSVPRPEMILANGVRIENDTGKRCTN
jgi:hypothetical protein